MSEPIEVTTQLLDEIDAGADVATPGPWNAHHKSGEVRGVREKDGFAEQVCTYNKFYKAHNAKHLARMDPPTSKALTARIRELESDLEEVHETLAEANDLVHSLQPNPHGTDEYATNKSKETERIEELEKTNAKLEEQLVWEGVQPWA